MRLSVGRFDTETWESVSTDELRELVLLPLRDG